MANVLHGDASNNQLNAAENRTQIYGLSGNDTLTNDGKSNVLLVGGSGNDSLIMSGGDGTLSGGAGNDTFELTYSADKKLSAVIEDFVPSEDKIIVNFDGDTAPQLTSSVSGNDVVWRDGSGNFNVTLKGVRDNDYLNSDVSNEAWKVLELTNAERENRNLDALTASDGLTRAAQIRAVEITKQGNLGVLENHTRPNGSQWYTVLDGKYNFPGENLDGGAATPQEVVEQWMSSNSHKENILNATYQKLGVGYNYDDPDPSNHRWYWTQLFADSLTNPETVSTDQLLTASPVVDTVSKFITLTENADTYSNSEYGATIQALGGGDSITNSGLIVSISGGNDNDTINNRGNFSTINAGGGNDSIRLAAQEVLIQYSLGDGNDTISGLNSTDTVSISGSEFTPATVDNDLVVAVGNDSITLTDAAGVQILGSRSKIFVGTSGAERIINDVDNATILGLGGNDSIENWSDNVSIDGGAGDDNIENYYGTSNVTIIGGEGNDSLRNFGNGVSIVGGAGDDTIEQFINSATIFSGAGNDLISLLSPVENSLIEYNAGDGNDTVYGFHSIDTLKIGGEYSTQVSDNNVIITVGDGSIVLINAASLSAVNIEGVNSLSADVITLTEGDDIYRNETDGATIAALGGNDSIRNVASNVSIDAGADNDTVSNSNVVTNAIIDLGAGNDTIYNWGDFVTINGGAGSDTVTNSSLGANVLIIGAAGNDSIYNGGDNTTLDAGAGNDTLYNYRYGSFGGSLSGGAGNDVIVNRSDSVTIDGGAGYDYIQNHGNNVTINGGTGDDTIVLAVDSQNILIQYASGDHNDSVLRFNETATLQIGDGTGTYSTQTSGDDIIVEVGAGSITLSDAATLSTVNIAGTERKYNELVTLTEGDDNYTNTLDGATIAALGGNDSVSNISLNVSISGDGGSDSINNGGHNVTIDGGDGDDLTMNNGSNVSINAGAGNDTIENSGNYVTITGGDGNDSIRNWSGYDGDDSNVTVDGGAGDDYIYNYGGDSVSIVGGEGDDTIRNGGSNVTITGGTGNDQISLSGGAENNVINYTLGDGDDIILGYKENTTINISGDTYTTQYSGDDIVINVGTGSITLKDVRDKPLPIIIGESGTEGGGSNSGNSGGSSSGDGGRGGNDGGNTSGGTSASEGSTSDFSGSGRSAVGSRGRGTSTSSNTSGGTVRVTSRNSRLNLTDPVEHVEFPNILTPSTQQTTATTQPTVNQRVYSGGNQIIGDYQSGEKIVFGEVYTGSFYDSAGNFCVGSSTGALVIQNAPDKVIDLQDAAGNDFLKAYSATTAGVIDGRGLAGFEIINGSAGSDAIFAGDGGSQLWGGLDVASDTIVGGGGTDIFIGGRTQGADVILNASSIDIVHLNDASLSDIIATEENNGAIALAFNTGNVVGVQSSEALSATFMLADGSAYRYNHANKSWQNA